MRTINYTAAIFMAILLAVNTGADEQQLQPDWTDGTLWESGDYVYDAAGNILAIGNDSYRYDSLSRLKTATAKTPGHDGNAQEFSYDRYGNILTATTAPSSLITGMAVDPATNQIDGNCPSGVSQCIRAGFDAAGNQISLDGTLNTYVWDDLGMLAERSITGQRTRYLYDANDERIAILSLDSQGAVTGIRYTLRGAGNKVARELVETPSGALSWSKDYVYRGSALLASFVTGENGPGPHRHYHLDHLGTPRLITDSAGYKLARHTYWPFGREAAGSELDNERMTFTGHERDSAGPGAEGMDLDYMHARFYDPTQGRFLSVDPTWESADLGRPQSWNRYAYVMNNPVNMTDPDGKCPQSRTGRPCGNPLNGSALVVRREKTNPINGEFGMTRNEGKKPHQGVDLLSKRGTPVTAADGGRIVFAGEQNGHGNIVIIAHQDPAGKDVSFTSYSHLDSITVKKNDTVDQGEQVGNAGRSGNLSDGIPTHLHFEIRKEQEPGKGEKALKKRVDPGPELGLESKKKPDEP